MATELKTDSWHRYMLYRSDERYRGFESEDRRRDGALAGRKYTLAAYPDVWAKDAALVQRARRFLGDNFHWHDRLAEKGTALEVVQTLHAMVRGGSVVVIPEDAPRGAGLDWPPRKPASSSFWGVENYDETPHVSVKDRYLAQLERMNAERPTWDETEAMMDGVNAEFMQAMFGIVPVASAILFSQAGWISKYGVPELSGIDGNGEGDAAAEGATPLGGGRAFEYIPEPLLGDAVQLAGGEGTPGNNQAQNKQFRAVVKALGLNQDQANELHQEISKQGLGYHEIMQRGQDMFGDAGDD